MLTNNKTMFRHQLPYSTKYTYQCGVYFAIRWWNSSNSELTLSYNTNIDTEWHDPELIRQWDRISKKLPYKYNVSRFLKLSTVADAIRCLSIGKSYKKRDRDTEFGTEMHLCMLNNFLLLFVPQKMPSS